MWVYAPALAYVFCFAWWVREREGDRFAFEDVRVRADLRDSVLSSSTTSPAVDLRLRDRERAADCDCLVGECDKVREDAVVEVGVSGTCLEADGGLVGSGGGGKGRGWWRVETIVVLLRQRLHQSVRED